MKALIIKEHGVAALTDVKEQSMAEKPDYIKVKTVAVAVNPTDLHHTAGAGRVGGILGCDLSGIVEEVGKGCKASGDIKKGDKVYGVCHCANLNHPEDGSFAEYALVRDGIIAKIPDNGLTFEETATLGTGITSVAQSLYMTLKLPLPGDGVLDEYILIYGGSSATGTLAIQFAKLSGLTVVTTASPENFDLVRSRGADAVFDYHDPNCAKQIRDFTNNSLYLVLDCVSVESSYKIVAAALPDTGNSEKPMQVVTLLPNDTWPRSDVTTTPVLAYTSLGKAFTKFGIDFPEIPAHYDFGVMFWKLANKLLAEGQIKQHPVALRKGGLGGIPDGLAEHAKGQVRACKLVYRVLETVEMANSGPTIKVPELGSQW